MTWNDYKIKLYHCVYHVLAVLAGGGAGRGTVNLRVTWVLQLLLLEPP